MVTDAKPSGLRSRVPAKITSSILDPRRLFADCSPSTQLIASLRLDFPQPLGPTTAAIPEPANFISVRSKNDLKPCISTRLSFNKIASPSIIVSGDGSMLTALGRKVKRVISYMLRVARGPYNPLGVTSARKWRDKEVNKHSTPQVMLISETCPQTTRPALQT